MTSSTPDALWGAPSLRVLRPAAVAWSGLHRGGLLHDCSLSVPAGTRLLVVSEPPSSASLLVRVLAGLAPKRSGRIRIAGSSDPSAEGWGRRVAYVGPEPGVRAWMTPREAMRLAASLLDMAPLHAARRTEQAVSWCRIASVDLDRPIRRGGPALAQRTALATALLGDPEVLLLDEPLRALDATERARLLRIPGARRTIVLASHYPASDAGIVSHVALMRDGRIALVAPVRDLEAAGLPLSAHGIAELARRRSDAPPPAAGVAAADGAR